jgi:uncharacterized protein YjbI with pentapeptide repeats
VLVIAFVYLFRLQFQLGFQSIALWLFPGNTDRNGEFLKIVLTVIGGLGVLYSLHLAYRRLKATNVSLELQAAAINKQSEQLELSRKGQVDERFKNAVEHLGSEKEPIILGGIVELHQIAKEDQTKYAAVVFNILTSYLRSVLKVDVPRDENFSGTIPQTILDFLFRDEDRKLYVGLKANLSHCNLKSLEINGANFQNGDFSFSLMPMHIFNVNFENGKFSRTEFVISRITNTSFRNADFHDNMFNMDEFKGVDFSGANLRTQLFLNAKFFDCNFNLANIYNCKFLLSHFEDTVFTGGELLNVFFWGSNFVRINFSNNEVFSGIDFTASGFHETFFGNQCFDCIFSGVRKNYAFEYIQLKDVEENLGKTVDKHGIKELPENLFLKCVWNKLTEDDFKKISDEFTNAPVEWKAKYKTKKKKVKKSKSDSNNN